MILKANHTTRHCARLAATLFLLFMLAGCGSDATSESEVEIHGTSQTGSIAFHIKWGRNPDADRASYRKAQSPSGDVCVDYGIETVAAAVYDTANQSLMTASFPCSEHSGVINGVPIGSGMRLMIEGLTGSNVLWRGEVTDITVAAGQTQPVGDVFVFYIGTDNTAPAITGTTPSPDATDVALDSLVAITFDEPIVPASANSTNIQVKAGDTQISGEIAYDDGTNTATFSPSSPFSYSTAYSVTITTGIEDLAANRLLQEQTWYFTTRDLSFTADSGSGGTIIPSGQTDVVYGTDQTYTITPNEGYYLSELLIDGSQVTPSLTYTFPSAGSNHTIAVQFKPVWYVDGSAAAGGDGKTWEKAFDTIAAAISAANTGDDIWIKKGNYLPGSEMAISRKISIYGGFNGDEDFLHQQDVPNNPTVLDGNDTIRLFNISAAVRIDGLTFQQGEIMGAAGSGGGIYNSADAVITNCTFAANTAYMYGGAIYNANCTPTISDCTFEDNITSGSTDGYGGAIYNQQSNGTIVRCRFLSNIAGYGAFTADGGAIYNNDSSPDIRNCYFTGNSAGGEAGYGGAIFNKNGAPLISGSIFSGNRTSGIGGGRGGAVYNDTTSAAIVSCTFWGNTAYYHNSDSYGGAVYNTDASPTISNSILWGNWATDGVQMYNASGTPGISYCNIDQDGFAGSSGNIRKEPLLNANAHLQSDSPCIDQADANTHEVDIDRESVPATSADMGADEFIDTDQDGMPDFWETTYGLNDADGDNDSDGLSNIEEYEIGSDPTQANIVINATNRGWWRNDGYHEQADNSTIVGRIYDDVNYISRFHRSYFSFNLSGITGNIVAAVLRIEIVDYTSIDPSETIKIYDIATSAATLEADGTTQTDIYDDIGTGTQYGAYILTLADETKVIQTKLERVDLNNYRGTYFSVGIGSDTLSGLDQTVRFSQGSESRIHQLVLIME